MAAKKNTVALQILDELSNCVDDRGGIDAALTEINWDRPAFAKVYPELHTALKTADAALNRATDLVNEYVERDLYDVEDEDY